jgi:hypothetical protein
MSHLAMHVEFRKAVHWNCTKFRALGCCSDKMLRILIDVLYEIKKKINSKNTLHHSVRKHLSFRPVSISQRCEIYKNAI